MTDFCMMGTLFVKRLKKGSFCDFKSQTFLLFVGLLLKERSQIFLLILNEFKRINQLHLPLKLSEN